MRDSFVDVEIFLKAHGRLPRQKGDTVSQETLDLFCKRYENKEIKTTTVDLELLYTAIVTGYIKPCGVTIKEK